MQVLAALRAERSALAHDPSDQSPLPEPGDSNRMWQGWGFVFRPHAVDHEQGCVQSSGTTSHPQELLPPFALIPHDKDTVM